MENYTEITSVDQWKKVLEQSSEKPVVVFKHSTTCPVSAHAYGEFSSFEKPLDRYLVKVIEHRQVSDEISDDLGNSTSISSSICYCEWRSCVECITGKLRKRN